MTSAELSEWLAYARVYPLPDPYWSSAVVAYTVAASNYPGKGPKPEFADYFPKPQGPPKRGAALRNMLIARFGARPAKGA